MTRRQQLIQLMKYNSLKNTRTATPCVKAITKNLFLSMKRRE